MNNTTHNPSAGPLADRMRDAFTAQQRTKVLEAATATADRVRDLSLWAGLVCFAVLFAGSVISAVFGSALFAGWFFCTGIAAAACFPLVGHMAAEIVFFIKAWNV